MSWRRFAANSRPFLHICPRRRMCASEERRRSTGSCGGGSPATRFFFPCALAAERSRQASRFRRRSRCCGWKATSSRSSRRRSRSGSPWFRTARSAFRWVSICPAALWGKRARCVALGKNLIVQAAPITATAICGSSCSASRRRLRSGNSAAGCRIAGTRGIQRA